VVFGGQVSDWSDVLSDVPQGSVLGPVLFVLYADDILRTIISKILQFTDDTKINYAVNSVEGIESSQSVMH